LRLMTPNTTVSRFQRRTPVSDQSSPITQDMLRGARAIALYLFDNDSKEDTKRVFRLARQKIIPVGRLGGTMIASKRALLKRYGEITSGEAEKVAEPEAAE
jgi:hypothetical protein